MKHNQHSLQERNMLDSVLVANEVIDNIKTKKKVFNCECGFLKKPTIS